MPCFYVSTNVCLDGVDTDPVSIEATKAISTIVGRPLNLVMVILKGSVSITFGGTREPAAYAELITVGGLTPQLKKQLIITLGSILQDKLSIPPTRFFLKVYDTTAHQSYSHLTGDALLSVNATG